MRWTYSTPLLLLLGALACTDKPDDTAGSDSGDSGDTSDSGDTGDTGDTETGDTGETSETGDSDTAPVTLTVAGAEVGCDDDSDATETLAATATGSGAISVHHEDWTTGCCPESFTVEAVADPGAHTIAASYTLGADPCDCICKLNADWSASGIPAGTWTVRAGTVETEVVVP